MQTGKYSDSFSKLWNLSFGGSEDSVRYKYYINIVINNN